ncbi:carboxypeptidase S3, penicillopeptidase S3, CPD-S3 [Tothia fuscella]|uniref:Carboxypeptidase n=1 Tax=Tothia fuscella TaxID=1048955 RepID=A0A9P4NYC4_9PEZI|nr:carboxypeptidase S3, penicillopeptidase S3, CPD-S3 [Tothia fuscella]
MAEPAAEADVSQFRFYSQDTSAFRVKSLPDVPFNIGEMYSGLMPVKAGDTSRQLFFVYQPTINAPVDEITIWMNGGPGCSSLEGFFQENGRFVWLENQPRPTINDQAWVNATNMLWVEQPIGTGFTVGTPTAKTEEEIAADFVGFFKNFQTTFGIKNFKIYVTGESYAGRYVPYISAAMLDKKDTEYFNLKGAMVYDPCIGQYDIAQQQLPAVPFVKANKQHFRFEADLLQDLEKIHASCGYKAHLDKYLTFPPPGHQPKLGRTTTSCNPFQRIQYELRNTNKCFNVYEISQRCPKPTDVMKGRIPYFNRADVKSALHAPPNAQWSMCSNGKRVFTAPRGTGPEREGDLSADPIEKVLPQVIKATNRVLVSNGDYDMIIITNGTLLSIQNMTWNGALGFQQKPVTPIMIPSQGDMGVQHFERGLMWAETYRTGHMGPGMAPKVAYRHLLWMLGRIETL